MANIQRKKVVVLGGGYAGATVAAKLDRSPGIDVTLVAPRDFILHKIAGLRASAKGGSWHERATIPLDKVIVNGQFVKASATSVNAQAKAVTLDNGQVIQYDALIVATGSRNLSPAEASRSVTTREGQIEYFKGMHEALRKTKNVVIVGSGAVGIELAGEVREFGQLEAKITIVGRSKQILNDSGKYRESGFKAVLKDLKNLNIDVISGDEVASIPFPTNVMEASPLVLTPEGVILKSGKKIECDLLVFAAGSFLNTEFLPPSWLDKASGEVLVDPKTLLLQGQNDVFAVGDIAKTAGPKRGSFAMQDANVVVKNVMQILKGKKPKANVQRMNVIVLTLGPNGGRGLLPFMTLGPKTTSMIKSKDLFTKLVWNTVGKSYTIPKVE